MIFKFYSRSDKDQETIGRVVTTSRLQAAKLFAERKQLPLKEFLKATGRRKYILPLYEALCKNPSDKTWALSVYKEAKGGYHAIAQQSVAEIFLKKP